MNDKQVFHLSNTIGLTNTTNTPVKQPQTDLPEMTEDDFTIPFITDVVETSNV